MGAPAPGRLRGGRRFWHLSRRFAGSLWPAGPGREAESQVARILSPAELALWARMGGPDRRHALGVAGRSAIGAAAGQAGSPAGPAGSPRPVAPATPVTWPPDLDQRTLLVAALLHDVGKVEAGLGTLGRVGATLAAPLLGRGGLTRVRSSRTARYLAHDRLGADLLSGAGSHPLVVAWAREHHLPPERWSVPPGVGAVLKAADDD